MTNYIKTFSDETAYSAFTATTDYVTPNVSYCSGGSNSVFFNPIIHDYSQDYLTFIPKAEGKFTIHAVKGGTTSNTISYSIGDGEWTNIAYNVPTPSVQAGQKIRFKGTPDESYTEVFKPIGTFQCTAPFVAEGNVMSMTHGDNFQDATAMQSEMELAGLFSDSSIISAENVVLPATTLAVGCYYCMFSGCTSLKTSPALPAMTLAVGCYSSMFSGCTSLKTSPELPATTLAHSCYELMFSYCSSLTTAPALPAMTLADNCYQYMFSDCYSLTTAPSVLPATTLAEGCYTNMFQDCTSLTIAPELPATTLTYSCYQSMFQDCTSLTTAPELPATTLADFCYYQMFYRCTSLAKAPELPATTMAKSCYSNMFSDCTKLGNVSIYGSLGKNTFVNSFGRNAKVYINSSDDCTIDNSAFVNNQNTGSLYLNSGTKWVDDDNLLNQFIGWNLYIDGEFIEIIGGGPGPVEEALQ